MENEKMKYNTVTISGMVQKEPEFSHTIYGESFYTFWVKVNRLSGLADLLPMMISDRITELEKIKQGQGLRLCGQLRSYNKMIDGVNRLILTVFVREIAYTEQAIHENEIEIEGFICKPTTYRVTPFGREITDMLVAVNRAYNKSDYIPCIAWGRNARFADHFQVGDRVKVIGRIQSREYEKTTENGEKKTRTAYEVSVNKLEKTS